MTLDEASRPPARPDGAAGVSESGLLELARSRFGIDVTSAAALPGERDRNLLLTAASGERFVLKLAPAGEDRAVLDLQHRAMERLRAAGLGYAFPAPAPSRDGREILDLADEGLVPAAEAGTPTELAGRRRVRLLTWVPGEPLARVAPRTPELLEELGAMLAGVDRALEGLDHAAADRDLYWNATGGRALVAAHLDGIAAAADRDLIRSHLVRFDAEFAPRAPHLRTALVHGDANDWNVLVDTGDAAARYPLPMPRIAGLVDFGDMVRSWLVAEPAIAAAYAMLGRRDPLAALAAVARGYHGGLPLREAEIEALYPLALLRLCMSVTLAARQRSAAPENEYLSISEAPAWALLRRLDDIHPRLARYVVREACGLPPCPAAPAVVAWLEASADAASPVLDPDPRTAPTLVLDLGVGGPLLGDVLGREEDSGAWTDAVFARMREAGAAIGVGRYDEARSWYRGEAFRAEGDERDEWRTIHIGLDLFAPPGTPVLAPLDGVVEAVRDNAGRLDYGPTVVLRHEPVPGQVAFHTLYGHLAPDALELAVGRAVSAGERVGAVGAPPGNGDWAPHLHFQLVTDPLDAAAELPGVARPSRRAVWTSLSPDPNLLLRIPGVARAGAPAAASSLLELRARTLGPSLSVSYRRPLHIVRGWMQRLYDADGQPYLDCVNNVAHVGHCHPRVVAALRRQAAALNTNTRYLHQEILRYAGRLASLLPEPLSVVYLVCTGSEANELALRLARAHTGRRDVVVLDGAYHGNTGSLVEISPYKFDGPGGAGRAPHVHVACMPDPYRGPHRATGAADAGTLGERYAAYVARAVAAAEAGGGVAAFFAESLLSCGGQIVLPDGYLRAAYGHVRAAGGVCVADEVQVGLGRVGSRMWGFETQGVVPDIVTLGKPIGNGHPLAAVVTTPEIASSFANGMEYFNTFGGNAVSCAVGNAVLDVVEEAALRQHALSVGGRLRDGLRALAARHRLIGDVRGLGLFLGIELVDDRDERTPAPRHAAHLVERMRDHGVLLSTDGPDHDVIKIKPPLVFDDADADRLLETLDRVLAEDALR